MKLDAHIDKYALVYLLESCLIGKIRPNVRIITIDWSDDFTTLSLLCFVDSEPDPKDYELMEDAMVLYISYGDNYKVEYKINVEFSKESLDKLCYNGKFILFARYED